MQQKWEYLELIAGNLFFHTVDGSYERTVSDFLQDNGLTGEADESRAIAILGETGWEMITALYTQNEIRTGLIYIFKRAM